MPSELPYVIAAYAITWIALGSYAMRLSRLARRTRAEAQSLR